MCLGHLTHPIKVSCNNLGGAAKSKAQNDLGSSTCICLDTSTGGLVITGADEPKNGYVYLQDFKHLLGPLAHDVKSAQFGEQNNCSKIKNWKPIVFFLQIELYSVEQGDHKA